MGKFSTSYEYDDEGNLIETNNAGSWEAGVNETLPGYIMKANPQVDDQYFQEFAPQDDAVDQARIVATNESILFVSMSRKVCSEQIHETT